MHNNEENIPITPSGVSHPHNMLHTGTHQYSGSWLWWFFIYWRYLGSLCRPSYTTMPAIYILNYPTLHIPDHSCVVCTEFECRGPPNTEMKYFIAKFGVRWSTHFIPVTMRFPVECFSVQYLVLLLGQCFLWHKCDYITAYCKTVSTVFSDNHWLNASISPSSTKTILFITLSWKRTLKMAQKVNDWLTYRQTDRLLNLG